MSLQVIPKAKKAKLTKEAVFSKKAMRKGEHGALTLKI